VLEIAIIPTLGIFSCDKWKPLPSLTFDPLSGRAASNRLSQFSQLILVNQATARLENCDCLKRWGTNPAAATSIAEFPLCRDGSWNHSFYRRCHVPATASTAAAAVDINMRLGPADVSAASIFKPQVR